MYSIWGEVYFKFQPNIQFIVFVRVKLSNEYLYIPKPCIIFLLRHNPNKIHWWLLFPKKRILLLSDVLLDMLFVISIFFLLNLSGMRLSQWCIMGVTLLLLLCEIAVSQLCKSLITMVDGFHTLFILLHMALPLTEGIIKPCISTSGSPPSSPRTCSSLGALPHPLHEDPPAELPPGAQSVNEQPNQDPVSLINSHKHCSTEALRCSLSFSNSRIQAVSVFISSLLLVSMCVSYFLEIISFMVKPHPVQHPRLPVVVGAGSLLLKMLLFVLDWDELLDKQAEICRQAETEPHLEINHKGKRSTQTMNFIQ